MLFGNSVGEVLRTLSLKGSKEWNMINGNLKISLQDIKQFEREYNVTLPIEYIDFLLKYNGGYPQESNFKISDDEGESLVTDPNTVASNIS